jgi:hypothetical protein
MVLKQNRVNKETQEKDETGRLRRLRTNTRGDGNCQLATMQRQA